MTLGAKIRELRIDKGWTREQLAKGLCSPNMVAQIESKEGRPSFGVLHEIADRLDVPLDHLIAETERREESLAQYQEALDLKRSFDFAGALERLEQLQIRPFFGIQAAELMSHLAECYLHEGELVEAFDWYHHALEEACAERNQEALVSIYQNLGAIEFTQGRFAYALRQFDRALSIAERLPYFDGAAITNLYLLQADCYGQMQNSKAATQCFRLAINSCESRMDRRALAWLMLRISEHFQAMHQEWEGHLYTERAAKIMGEIGMVDRVEGLRSQYAILLGITGSLTDLSAQMERLLLVLEAAGFAVEAGMGYVEVAELLSDGAEVELAAVACRQALQRLPEELEYRTCVLELQGRIACERHQYQEAAHLFQLVADGYKKMKQAKNWANAMRMLSGIHQEIDTVSVS